MLPPDQHSELASQKNSVILGQSRQGLTEKDDTPTSQVLLSKISERNEVGKLTRQEKEDLVLRQKYAYCEQLKEKTHLDVQKQFQTI